MTAPVPGTLPWQPAADHPELLGAPVAAALPSLSGPAWVAEIDDELADTAAFTEAYGVPPEVSANCVVVAARRGGETTLAACLVLATTRADVNGLVRKHLGARKASFAPQDVAVAESGMAFGGITPVGLPARLSGSMPADSTASHATSSSSRCWGSIRTASRGEMPKKSASNRSTWSRNPPQRGTSWRPSRAARQASWSR